MILTVAVALAAGRASSAAAFAAASELTATNSNKNLRISDPHFLRVPALMKIPVTRIHHGPRCKKAVNDCLASTRRQRERRSFERLPQDAETRLTRRVRLNGAAQESNLPSRGLHDRTGFEDRLGHRAHAAPGRA